MRLDKFLKTSRLIKQRSRAKQLCDQSAVTLNGRVAKAGNTVNPGDIICFFRGENRMTVKVLTIPRGNVRKSDAQSLYEIVEVVGSDEDRFTF